ncbi:MAG: ABC transporter permease [Bacillota bacterium]
MGTSLMKKIISSVMAVLFVLLVWLAGALFLNKPFLPTPQSALAAFFSLWLDGVLEQHFLISSYRVIVSIAIAFIMAVPLGLILGRNEKLDRLVSPVIYVLYPLPKIVFLPIIVVLMGLGNLPKIFLITIIIFFQVAVTARDASKGVPFQSIQSMRSLNASTWQIYLHLIWPYCLPKVLTSLRISLGTAVAVLFLAETFASTDGVGYFILDAMERREYGGMYAGIIAMGLLGLLVYCVVDYIEYVYCRWQKL